MTFISLVEKIVAEVTPQNIQLYINLLESVIAAAEKIEDAQNSTQTPPQNGSAS
jgi:hypothetical protein